MPLPIDTHIALALCMMLGAALYSSVGHAGASAYIALMALFGMPAAVMRPTALVLNIVVGTLASLRFASAGLFHWPTLWPLLVGAIPAAFIGGSIDLPGSPLRFDDNDFSGGRPSHDAPPTLGQHNEAIREWLDS